MNHHLPPQDLLHRLLSYDQQTGEFRWLAQNDPSIPASWNKKYAWRVAGTQRKTGYRFISIRGFGIIGAHRLAWIYVYGPIPGSMEIDHRDGNRSNNAIANLRPATSSQQKRNKGVQSNNRAGLKGAFYHTAHKGKKWRSQIKVGQRLIFLGYFHTAQEAHGAYAKAAREHFKEFARVA